MNPFGAEPSKKKHWPPFSFRQCADCSFSVSSALPAPLDRHYVAQNSAAVGRSLFYLHEHRMYAHPDKRPVQ